MQRWGEPRSTVDLDLTVLTGFGNERSFANRLLEHFSPRIRAATEFALLHRVLLLTDQRGTPLDVSFGAMPFEEQTVARASPYEIVPGRTITICSATDLIIHKAFACRPQDWIDVRGIVARSGPQIDWEIVEQELTVLAQLKEEPEILDHLKAIREEVRRR